MSPLLLSLAAAATLDVPAAYADINAALAAAAPGDVIQLAPGIYCEDVDITVAVTLQGPSAGGATIDGTCGTGTTLVTVESGASGTILRDVVIDGAGAYRSLYVLANVDAVGEGLTLVNGDAGASNGGGVRVDSGGTFECTDCRIETNTAVHGGGVYATGDVILIDTVLCDNSADTDGGGANVRAGSVLRRVAVARNTAAQGGGLFLAGTGGHQVHNSVLFENTQTGDPQYGSAIFVGEALDVRNTIFVGNVGSLAALDNDDELNSGGHNLYASNVDGHVSEPYPTDILDGYVNFVDPGIGCTFDLSLDANLPNDGIGTGDPSLDASGDPVDMGLGWVGPVLLDSDGDLFPDDIDCGPADASICPGAPEGCNGIDNDCDGRVTSAERDDDLDGFANCEGDCDDGDIDIFPGAPVTATDVGDGVDRDCNGFDECFFDGDGDGVGTATSFPDADTYGVCLAGASLVDGDCDDGDDQTFPGAIEVCDGIDNDCDNDIDDDDDVGRGAHLVPRRRRRHLWRPLRHRHRLQPAPRLHRRQHRLRRQRQRGEPRRAGDLRRHRQRLRRRPRRRRRQHQGPRHLVR